MTTMMASTTAADQQTTGQDSDPDMDDALRRVRQEPFPQPGQAVALDVKEAGVLFELELVLLGIRPVAGPPCCGQTMTDLGGSSWRCGGCGATLTPFRAHVDGAPFMGVGGDDGSDDACVLCGKWTCRC